MKIDTTEVTGANRSWTIFVVPRGSSGGRGSPRETELSQVGDLKMSAERSFQQGFLRLVTADGRILGDPTEDGQSLLRLLSEGLREEECLTAVVLQAKLAVTEKMGPCGEGGAFALWCCSGNRIITWGHPDYAADSSAVQDQLRNVQQVQGTCAFAAILADGSAVTWGYPDCGGDSNAVQDQLLKL